MGCSRNHGPLLVMVYIMAPNNQGYHNGTLIWGATHISKQTAGFKCGMQGMRPSLRKIAAWQSHVMLHESAMIITVVDKNATIRIACSSEAIVQFQTN